MAQEKKLIIPTEVLNGLGLNMTALEKDEETLRALESGAKTKLLQVKGVCNGKEIPFAARIHLWEDATGAVHPYIHPVQPTLYLGKYKGHEFTKEEKSMLLQDDMITHPVNLKFKDKEVSCLVGVDKDTKEIVHVPTSNVYIQDKLLGVNISKEQKEIIKNGGKIYVPEFTRTNGETFASVLQFSFSKNNGAGGLLFRTPTPKLIQEARVTAGMSEGKEKEKSKEKSQEGRKKNEEKVVTKAEKPTVKKRSGLTR